MLKRFVFYITLNVFHIECQHSTLVITSGSSVHVALFTKTMTNTEKTVYTKFRAVITHTQHVQRCQYESVS